MGYLKDKDALNKVHRKQREIDYIRFLFLFLFLFFYFGLKVFIFIVLLIIVLCLCMHWLGDVLRDGPAI